MNDLERVANMVMAKKVPEKIVEREEDKANAREVLAAAGPIEEPKKPVEAPPDLPEPVKRTQKLIEALHEGHELRKRQVAAKLRRGVEIENELRQAQKDRDERLFGARKIHEEEVIEAGKLRDFRCNVIESAFDALTEQRSQELAARGDEISKLDKTLEQLRKQLDAEIRKLDPERKVPA